MPPKRHWHALAVAGCVIVSGCTVVTSGTVRPADGLSLGPLTGSQLDGVIPNADQMAEIVGDRLGPSPDAPEMSGGLSDMADGLSSDAKASPHECVGATSPLQRSIYRSTGLTEFAALRWRLPSAETGDVLSVTTGVAAFDSTTAATGSFEAFVGQWEDCDGTVVKIPTTDGDYFTDEVTNVRVENSVLSADVATARMPDGIGWPRLRAIGVRANCLVEVDVSFNGGRAAPAGLEDSAIALADFMMNRIAEIG